MKNRIHHRLLGLVFVLIGIFFFAVLPAGTPAVAGTDLVWETDTDKDGVPDAEEKGPEGNNETFDGNNDGTPDYQQRRVVSFHSWNTHKYITLYVSEPAYFLEAANLDPSRIKSKLEGDEFPFGFLMIRVGGIRSGGPLIIRALLHEQVTPSQFYLYHPLEKGESPRLLAFGFNCDIGAEWYEGAMLIHLVDGFSGDRDLEANGEVALLGGPVFGELPEDYFYPDSKAEASFHTHVGENQISIHLDEDSPGFLKMIQIESINGELVLEQSIDEPNIREYDLDVSILQCGLYDLVVYFDQGMLKRKILITE
jgi:hypothetical protein